LYKAIVDVFKFIHNVSLSSEAQIRHSIISCIYLSLC